MGRKILLKTPRWAAGMTAAAAAGREWMRFRRPVWRDSAAQLHSRPFESPIRAMIGAFSMGLAMSLLRHFLDIH